MVFRLTGDDTQIYLTKDSCYFLGVASSTVARRTSSSVKFRPHMISTLSVRRFCTRDDRRGVGQLEALRTFDGDYRSRDLVGRDVRIMEPSVLSVASMCRAVIFGPFR